MVPAMRFCARRALRRIGKAQALRARRQSDLVANRGDPATNRADCRAFAIGNHHTIFHAPHDARQKIRFADERGDKAIARSVVQILRGADLRDQSFVHHRDPVRHRQRLLLIVRDIDEGDAEIGMQAPHLELQALAQLLVECPERLVHQQQPRPEHDRAGQRDTLLLAAG